MNGPRELHGHDVDRVIRRLADRQDGAFTRAQLVACGISEDTIDHRLRWGRLTAVYRAIYSMGPLSDHGRIRAALFAAGPLSAACNDTSAFLDRLIPTLPHVLHVCAPAPAGRSRPALVIHGTTRPFARRFVDGLPTTTTLRTLEDLGWPERLVREALARRLVRPEELPRRVEIAPTESELEERMRRLCVRAGLPQPVFQHRIGPYRIDFAWPRHRVLVETDGFATHGHQRAFENDRSRDADLIAQGYVVIRITWRQLCRAPTLVASRLAAALALRAAA